MHRVAGKKKWVNGSGSLERDTRRPRWGGLEREERRHVRGRRMFYGFIICRVVSPRAEERFLYFPLIFLLFFFFFTEPRCGIAREEQETACRFEIG